MPDKQTDKVFLFTTYVDYRTNIPMNVEPTRNGHKVPDGVVPVFDLQEARYSNRPTVCGWAEEGFELQPYMNQVDEETFWSVFKEELKSRVSEKRWQVETGGVMIGEGESAVFVGTTIEDQNRITSVVSNARMAGVQSVDFKALSGFTSLTVEEIEGIAATIALHVQDCFSWERNMHEAIDALELSLETVGDTLPILESINTFGQEEFVEGIPEEPVSDEEA